jgi:hypothetical protein
MFFINQIKFFSQKKFIIYFIHRFMINLKALITFEICFMLEMKELL